MKFPLNLITLYQIYIWKDIIMKNLSTERKKQLFLEYQNRKPEMGVISYRCKATGESFLGISKDTKADFNSTNTKLSFRTHPNKRMQELWNQGGQECFELSVLKILKYKDLHEDYTEKLEALRKECLNADSNAKKIWR
jgi:hypothetical protein